MIALDLFAGSGWGVACQRLGISEYGVENMSGALETRRINGMETVFEDVWDGLTDPSIVPKHDILIASPPCQTFSVAGKQQGTKERETVISLISRVTEGESLVNLRDELSDERTALVLSPLEYALAHRPEYIVWEQVTSVLPIWEACADVLRGRGYSVVTDVLNAADYGVPQSRRRAILMASRSFDVKLPDPQSRRLSMFEALGWGLTSRPSPTITSHTGITRTTKGSQLVYERAIEAGEFVFKKPLSEGTPSKVAKTGIGSKYPPDCINASLEEEALLQTYPAGFQFGGTKREQAIQVGNAVPPLFAETLLRALVDGPQQA